MKKKKLLMYIIALSLTVVLSVNLLYAWFNLNKEVDTSFELSVIPEHQDIYENIVKITRIIDEVTLEESGDVNAPLVPGRLNLYKIEVTNDVDVEVSYKLKFKDVQITPATFPTLRNYNSYICDLYEKDGDSEIPYIPSLSGSNAEQLLKAMSEPVTNALSFYCGKQASLREFLGENHNYDKTLLTEFGDDSVDVTDENYKEFVDWKRKTICAERNIPINAADGDEGGEWIVIPQGEKVSIYLAIYFDGTIGTDGVYDSKSLVMHNSNGFMWQQVKITVALTGGRFS